jgi:vacuolar protein sorting-associated protein VTA1
MEAKLKYARFKAASLAKAFKAGVPPQAGPPIIATPADETLAALTQARDEAGAGPSTQTWSAAATPGQVGEEHDLELRSGSEGFPFAGEEAGATGGRVPLKRKSSKVRFEGLPGDVTPGSDIVSGRTSPQPPSFPSPPPAVVSPPRKAAPAPAPPPPTPPPAPAADSGEPLSLAQIEKIQKHAKWAISALNYEDVDTARSELREALRLLG